MTGVACNRTWYLSPGLWLSLSPVPRSGNPSIYQNYLIYPLGVASKDGAWHVLERDLNADTQGLFQRADYIVVIGSVRIDDVTFGS